MSATDSPSTNERNPWLGLASFTEETRAFFFGREEEILELERRVQRKLLTILFGKSGLGKTSILQAGLVPRLRARGYFPVYLRIDYGHDSPEPAEQIKQEVERAAASGAAASGQTTSGEWTQSGVTAPGESIWEFLHHRDAVLKDASGATLTPLLIFDQFEELFTLAQSDEFGRARAARFVEELADLVENRPPKALEARLETDESAAERFDFSRSDYRVVIALREDYLAPLESLKKQMPSLSQNRLRLAPMTGSQALEAVLRPGRELVSEEVAEAIVRFVAGGSELANAEVEPSLLSLICRELNEQRVAQGRSEISLDLLAGSHDSILSSFYERSLADQPASVRRIIEDDLLTESGYRENLAEESLVRRFQAAGAAPDALAKLVNRRLLRIEERLDVRRVELTHDVLTGVVKASRDQRHESEARAATERTLAEQREREQAARRALRRARAIAAGCTLLAAVAVVAAVLAFVNVQRARRAEVEAQQTRLISEQARGQAEGLLGFLSDDFVQELETFGRYQTIAELSQREIDYFRALPPQLKDPQAIRSGALALVNHAEALIYLGDLATANRNATDAIALLEQLRRGDQSEATALVLAHAYAARSDILVQNGQWRFAAPDDSGALALLRPIAERTGAKSQARRAYIRRLATDAYLQSFATFASTAEREQVAGKAREAMRLAEQLGARHLGDFALDADYILAGASLVRGLAKLGRNEEALRVGKDVLAVATQVLAQRPQYGYVLGSKLDIEQNLAAAAVNALDPSGATGYALDSTHTALARLALEPDNRIYAQDAATAYEVVASSMWNAGQLRQSIAYSDKSLDASDQSRAGVLSLVSSITAVTTVAIHRAQLGDLAGAAATSAAWAARINPAGMGMTGRNNFSMSQIRCDVENLVAATVALDRDDFSAAQRIARAGFACVPPAQATPNALCTFPNLEGLAEYGLGDFAAAVPAERTAQQACASRGINDNSDQLDAAQAGTWLAMALVRQGEPDEAARTIGPIVAMYLALEKQNRSDQWLPLELAAALYAQALTDERRRPALLRQAAQRLDHLIPAIAELRETRQWRARIEKAQHGS
jgi:hypothetical protein